MRRFALSLWVSLGLFLPASSIAGGAPARPPQPSVAKRVWTSEEVEALRDKGLISLIGPESPAEASPTEQTPPTPEMPAARVPRPVRAQDPEWYQEQVAMLRSVIALNNAEIHRMRRELSDARYWEPGINLNRENIGITPQNALEILDARNQAELEKIEALWDQARRNSIPPGALR